MIISDNYCYFWIKTYVVTPQLNCLDKTVQMRGHNIRFDKTVQMRGHNIWF